MRGDADQNYITTLLEDWDCRPDSSLSQLIQAIKNIGRADLLEELKGYKEWLHQGTFEIRSSGIGDNFCMSQYEIFKLNYLLT